MAAGRRLLANDLFSLWVQAPFVIAMRTQAMGAAALSGRAYDIAEANRMVAEKIAASTESMAAVHRELTRQGLAAFASGLSTGSPAKQGARQQKLTAAAVRPYAKRVRANSKRLSGKRSTS